jgi:hypothetical protein
MSARKTYVCLREMTGDRAYFKGDLRELDIANAANLLALGVIREATEEEIAPSQTEAPAVTDQPAVTEEPSVTDQPEVTEELESSDQPDLLADEQPRKRGK